MSASETYQSLSPQSADAKGKPHYVRKHPCVLCQQRKVKCDRNEPCGNCTKARAECVSIASLPPRKRKKRFSEAELLTRLKRYEEHLKGYGADLKAINEGASICKTDSGSLRETEFEAMTSLSVRRSMKHVVNNLWAGMNEDFRETEEILQGSSEDEMFETPISKTYDDINSGGNDFLLPTQDTQPLGNLHPSPVQIFRLWQTFLDSVNPLIKLFHAPTVQQQILDASTNLSNVSKNMEALMFSIYASAVYSMGEHECRSVFDQEKAVLLQRYHSGARQALHRAGFLRSSDMTILQAFVLYLISCLHFSMDPRSLFCLTGIAVRMAQRMGLNFDGTNYGLRPFEIEMRRRLWWQLVLLDARVADLSGAGSAVLTYEWTTKLPLNINDSDLFPDMRETPAEHPGITEMVFVLQRCEVCELYQHPEIANGSPETKTKLINELEERLQRKYLNYCDASVPLHSMSALIAKMALCKLRMGPRPKTLLSSLTNSISQAEKDRLFLQGLTIIEIHNLMLASTNLKRFLWHVYTNFPFPAHVYLLCALRYRTTGELADRAWKQFAESYESRTGSDFSHRGKDNALHLAVANLTVKAWEARENALLQQFQPAVATPRFISTLRQKLASRRLGSSGKASLESSPPGTTDRGFGDQLGGWFTQQRGDDLGDGFDPDFMNGFMPQDPSMMGWGLFDNMMGPSDAQGLSNY